MSFLAPLFLAGALAVAAPIIFHLIRRTSRDKTPFSSLMFLQPTPPRVTRRSRLENIWLLLLRCLVLCLLALGFARPFFQNRNTAQGATAPGNRMVLLIDTSASMRRGDLWRRAQDRVEKVLSETTPADQVSVLAFDRDVHSVVSFEQWASLGRGERVPQANERVAALKPGWSGTRLGNALIVASETLEEAGARSDSALPAQQRQIVVVSDLQEGSQLERLQGYEWPKNVAVRLENLGFKSSGNAGIQAVGEGESAPANAAVGPRIRVVNSRDAQREEFQVAWVDGQGASIGAPINVYVPPGQNRVVAAPELPDGIKANRIRLGGDAVEFDNLSYWVAPKADRLEVLYLSNDAPSDTSESLYYLRLAFQGTRRRRVEIKEHPVNRPLLAAETESAALMLVTEPPPESWVPAIRDFLKKGRTVLVPLRTPESALAISRIVGSAVSATEGSPKNYAMFGQIDFEHPLFAPFADPRFSDFTKIHFWKFRQLDTNGLAQARILARFDNGDPALVEIPLEGGRLLVLTSTWRPADSQLALSSKFVPLLHSILEQSAPQAAELARIEIGDAVSVPASVSGNVQVKTPAGTEVAIGSGAKFLATTEPGIYLLTSLQATQRFAVNLAAAESQTAPLAEEDFVRLRVPLQPRTHLSAEKIEEKRRHLQATELENRQKIWRWLILAALVVLLFETFFAGWLTRRQTAAVAA